MVSLVLWVTGFFAVYAFLVWFITLFLGANGPDEDEVYALQRAEELRLTHIALQQKLGRPPTTEEVWYAAPPRFDRGEVK